LDNQALKDSVSQVRECGEKMQRTTITYTSVVGIYIALFILAVGSTAISDQVWSVDGHQFSSVPENLLVLGTSFVMLISSIILQNQKTKKSSALETTENAPKKKKSSHFKQSSLGQFTRDRDCKPRVGSSCFLNLRTVEYTSLSLRACKFPGRRHP
jgi:hypothetical protein